jgi:hypothetical protein
MFAAALVLVAATCLGCAAGGVVTPSTSTAAGTGGPSLSAIDADPPSPSPSPTVAAAPSPSASPAVSASLTVSPSPAASPSSSPGPFRMDVYRAVAFVTQPNLLYCVPGAAAIMVNLVRDERVAEPADMAAMYRYGQSLAAYPDEGAGVDPVGWVGILERWGAPGYGWRSYATLDAAIHHAAARIRSTGRPVGIPVGIHKGHAWVITGFAATADPASGGPFTVTAVAVTGALWPMQRYYLGYFDMPPDSWLTPADLAGAALTFRANVPTRWDGRFVTIEP